jgi:hypothetical protein
MKRVMTIALALVLLAGAAGEATARVYAIGNLTPDVILDGDPEYPGVTQRTQYESVPVDGTREATISIPGGSCIDVRVVTGLWSVLWRFVWAPL